MAEIKSIGVFGGGRAGRNPDYTRYAFEFGKMAAQAGFKVVYGAGSSGVMGAIARGVLSAGGKLRAITSKYLYAQRKEDYGLEAGEYLQFDDLLVAPDIAARKAALFKESDAFVIMPGGFGTMDEALSIIIMKFLKEHDKPIIFLNTGNFWVIYKRMERLFLESEIASDDYPGLVEFAETPEEAMEIVQSYCN